MAIRATYGGIKWKQGVMIVALIFETIEKIDVFEVLNWFLEFQFSADNGGQLGCPKKSDKFPLLKFFSNPLHLHSTKEWKFNKDEIQSITNAVSYVTLYFRARVILFFASVTVSLIMSTQISPKIIIHTKGIAKKNRYNKWWKNKCYEYGPFGPKSGFSLCNVYLEQ